jgi:ATP-dependent Clp protease adapter protein ClpS
MHEDDVKDVSEDNVEDHIFEEDFEIDEEDAQSLLLLVHQFEL